MGSLQLTIIGVIVSLLSMSIIERVEIKKKHSLQTEFKIAFVSLETVKHKVWENKRLRHMVKTYLRTERVPNQLQLHGPGCGSQFCYYHLPWLQNALRTPIATLFVDMKYRKKKQIWTRVQSFIEDVGAIHSWKEVKIIPSLFFQHYW